jgi:hypothetical protein
VVEIAIDSREVPWRKVCGKRQQQLKQHNVVVVVVVVVLIVIISFVK